jgi:hypothetical protein
VEKKKARRGGKKNRKHGRNSRKPGSSRQSFRTASNKASRMHFEEVKAGRQLSWQGVNEDAMARLAVFRQAWQREFGT